MSAPFGPTRVESRRSAVAVGSGELPLAGGFRLVPVPQSEPSLRFSSPLIKPDVRISRIRLSDWFHLEAHGGAPRWRRRIRTTPISSNTVLAVNRRVPRVGTLWR